MKYLKPLFVLTVIVCSCLTSFALHAEDEPAKSAKAHGTTKGVGPPSEKFVYSNQDGTWIIGPNQDNGTGIYKFKGQDPKITDTLTYYGKTTLKDENGKSFDGWIYKGNDASNNSTYWFFGLEKIGSWNGKNYFGLFYCLKDNPDDADFQRYRTNSWTSRQ